MTSYSLMQNLANLITFLGELNWETLVPLMLDLAAILIYLMLLRALKKSTKEVQTQKTNSISFLMKLESFSEIVIQILRKHFLTEASKLSSGTTSHQPPTETEAQQMPTETEARQIPTETEAQQILNQHLQECVDIIIKEFDINE